MSGETKHSPEPWRKDPSDHGLIDIMCAEHPVVIASDCDADDAARIIACVNALAGIPTAALEAGALNLAIATLHLVHECLPDKQAVTEALRALGRLP